MKFKNLKLFFIALLFFSHNIFAMDFISSLQRCENETQMCEVLNGIPLELINSKGDFSCMGNKRKILTIKDASALHIAVIMGYENFAKDLLKKGIDPNVRDALLYTPMHYVCLYRKKFKFLEILAEYNANLELCNTQGISVRYLIVDKFGEEGAVFVEKVGQGFFTNNRDDLLLNAEYSAAIPNSDFTANKGIILGEGTYYTFTNEGGMWAEQKMDSPVKKRTYKGMPEGSVVSSTNRSSSPTSKK